MTRHQIKRSTGGEARLLYESSRFDVLLSIWFHYDCIMTTLPSISGSTFLSMDRKLEPIGCVETVIFFSASWRDVSESVRRGWMFHRWFYVRQKNWNVTWMAVCYWSKCHVVILLFTVCILRIELCRSTLLYGVTARKKHDTRGRSVRIDVNILRVTKRCRFTNHVTSNIIIRYTMIRHTCIIHLHR